MLVFWIIAFTWTALIAFSIGLWGLKYAPWYQGELPPILSENHKDWWWPLRWVSRRLTAWMGRRPLKLLGNNPLWSHHDVPEPGCWVLCVPFYFAVRFHSGLYFRLPGLRYDYIDGYYNLTFGALRFYDRGSN